MTKEQYEAKFKANQRISGFGLEVTMHMPCPACAEPDFLIYKVIETEEKLKEGAVCKHCGFGMRAIFTHKGGSSVSFEMVQTHGDPPPDFLPPIRRIEPVTDMEMRRSGQ